MDRASGILLHPTSLDGPYGIGSLGEEAYRFVDWLAAAGQKIWQVLPLGPVGYGESPYQLFSAFAGNPLLLALDGAIPPPHFPDARVDFERVAAWKMDRLREEFSRHSAETEPEDETEFPWLEHYARFMALKSANGGKPWWDWTAGVGPGAGEMRFQKFLQRRFFQQWRALKRYCRERGIKIVGDLPIYVAKDSADVWSQPELFRFDVVGGVPPDYFSATGQLWGNPIYQWSRMAADGYRWWTERMRAALDMFDVVRIDHFRGFEAYWEVPAHETTAVGGRWVKGPGAELFRVLESRLGRLPVIAENLGVITPEVEALREEFGYPGMAVLEFAFGIDPQAPAFQPHNYIRNLAAYTGTHDNDPVMAWWRSEGGDSTRMPEDVRREKEKARDYLACDVDEMNWTMIRALMASVADLVVFPMQDVLGLGREARMNQPSTASGNWRWRMTGPQARVSPARLRRMAELYGRL